jgi:hypothetical protein
MRANLFKRTCLILPPVRLFTGQRDNVYFSRTAEDIPLGTSKVSVIEWGGGMPEQPVIKNLEKSKSFCEVASTALFKVNDWTELTHSVACPPQNVEFHSLDIELDQIAARKVKIIELD